MSNPRRWRRRRDRRVLVIGAADNLTDWHKHNYAAPMLALRSKVQAMGPGVYHVDCWHDDWCSIYRGGYCDCDVDVRLRGDPGDN